MPPPIDLYREGYDRGRKDTLGGRLAQMTMGLLHDDPGGHFSAGYSDGAAGKKFNPPSDEVRKAPPLRKASGSSLTLLEKQWYALCDSSAFIAKYMVDYYVAALNAQGSQVTVVIGLHNFTGHTCPKCGEQGQFKIRFLGRLEHPDPECRWTGYMGIGSYIGFQITQVFHIGIRVGGSMKEDSDNKGDRSGGWINGLLVFLFVGICRALMAVALIPLHTIVALCQTGQKSADVVTRIITLCLIVAGLGIGIYEIQHASRPQFQPSQPVGYVQAPSPQSANTPSAPNTYQPAVRPSFDCGKARTRVELLICRDGRLANFEADMASTYHQTLNRLPQDAQVSLRREHLAWFKNYSRTCNQSANDVDRAACIEGFLSAHTAELKNRPQ